MTILKCKMCGGDLNVEDGMTVCECEYCFTKQTVPTLNNEKKTALFTRANRLRSMCEFDKAYGVYESIVSEFSDEAEAYWGLILCKYGIEYVDDPSTGKKIPTCHRSSFESVMDDTNFEMVLEYSDVLSRAVYRDEAKRIEELRKNIIEISSKEEPYDIFICYKETTIDGERTLDSVLAQDMYKEFTDEGYRVFFSRITLEDKLGQEYEPYIFAALHSAKIMIAIGTDYEYFNAVWVKNEWSRFLHLIANGEKKVLIPCYKGIDAYDMPKEFARLQAQDLGKVGAIQDLLRGIEKIIGVERNNTKSNRALDNSGSDIMNQRGYMALEDEDYSTAENFFERALDINPEDSRSYLGKVLVRFRKSSIDELMNVCIDLTQDKDFKRAEKFADSSLIVQIEEIKKSTGARVSILGILKGLDEYRKRRVCEHFIEKMLEIIDIYACEESVNEERAKQIVCDLVSEKVITEYEASRYCENICLLKDIFIVLMDCSNHSITGMSSEEILNEYNHSDVRSVSFVLANSKCVEKKSINIFSLKCSDEIRKELEIRRMALKKEQYKRAMVCLGLATNAEQDFLIEEENRRHEVVIMRLQNDLSNEEIASKNREAELKVLIENKMRHAEQEHEANLISLSNSLETAKLRHKETLERKEQELSSLGFFSGKRKKELLKEIEEYKASFKKEESELELQLGELSKEYQRSLSTLSRDLNSVHDKEIRIKQEIESENILHDNTVKRILSETIDYKRGVQILETLGYYKDCTVLLNKYKNYV